jgi:hypothetical protein
LIGSVVIDCALIARFAINRLNQWAGFQKLGGAAINLKLDLDFSAHLWLPGVYSIPRLAQPVSSNDLQQNPFYLKE